MTRPNRFHEREASILYPSCFDANAGLFEQICGPEVDFNIHNYQYEEVQTLCYCVTVNISEKFNFLPFFTVLSPLSSNLEPLPHTHLTSIQFIKFLSLN